MALRHPRIPDGVHGGEICHIGKPDRALQDLGFVRADFGQKAVDLGKAIFGLLGDIGLWAADLAREIDHIAVGDDLAHAGVGVMTCDLGHGAFLFNGLLTLGEALKDGKRARAFPCKFAVRGAKVGLCFNESLGVICLNS